MIVHTDGSCYHGDKRMGVGIAFFEDDSYTPFMKDAITILGRGTSNEAEYHAIIQALMIILTSFDTQQECITINSDSQIVIMQITGEWECRNEGLKPLLKEALRLYSCIDIPRVLFGWVPREDIRQKQVDVLSKIANPYFSEKPVKLRTRKPNKIKKI